MDSLIGPVPESWQVSALGDVCSVSAGPGGGMLATGGREEDSVPILAPRNIGDGRIVTTRVDHVPANATQKLSRHRLVPGDVVCVRTGDLGRHAVVGEEQRGWICGTGCIRLRPESQLSSRYLGYYLSHPAIRDWIKRNATGSTMPSLSTQAFKSMPVAIPPSSVQLQAIELLEALDDKVSVHQEISRVTAELREVLLPQVVRGEIPVEDWTEER